MSPDKTDNLADQLLAKIRLRPKHPYNISRLAKSLKVTDEKILTAAKKLKRWGYKVRSLKKSQLVFFEATDLYLPDEVTYKLKTKFIGRDVLAYQTVQSTNTLAHVLAASGAPEGTLIVSEHQKMGRGRLGRKWHSPDLVGLYCSIILKPKINPAKAPGISLITALAVVKTIETYGDFDLKIKWPNDVLISGKKVCGILTEMSAEFNQTHFVIAGIGININHQRSDFPEDIKKTSGSIRLALGKKIRRVDFLRNFLRNFEKEYIKFKNHGLDKSLKNIIKYSSLINSHIKLKMGRKTISGKVLDIDKEGRLVVDTGSGISAFNAGEVTSSRPFKSLYTNNRNFSLGILVILIILYSNF